MRELDAVLDGWDRLRTSGEAAVLATVVHVTGSAYRRPGARMLVDRLGGRIGSVSGGCLEGDIVRRAWWSTASGDPVVQVYDTSADDDGAWEFGLGCDGVVSVMLERTDSPDARALLEFLEVHRHARVAVLVATVIAATPGAGVRAGHRLLMPDGQSASGSLAQAPLAEAVLRAASDLRVRRHGGVARLGTADVLIEWIEPPLRLVVFGAGDDARPVASVAGIAGWRVAIADGRPAYARRDRFPDAADVILLDRRDLLRGVAIDEETAVVLMTHNYPLDLRLLPRVLERRPRYLGLLGPRTRAERLFADLGQAMPSAVHAPVGLDLGGDGPLAAALAIVSEIQAVLHGREGGKLRLRRHGIHDPVLTLGTSDPVAAQVPARPAYCETLVGSRV